MMNVEGKTSSQQPFASRKISNIEPQYPILKISDNAVDN